MELYILIYLIGMAVTLYVTFTTLGPMIKLSLGLSRVDRKRLTTTKLISRLMILSMIFALFSWVGLLFNALCSSYIAHEVERSVQDMLKAPESKHTKGDNG